MLHRIIHGLLNKQKSASYLPYQDLENKQMLFELLTKPSRISGQYAALCHFVDDQHGVRLSDSYARRFANEAIVRRS